MKKFKYFLSFMIVAFMALTIDVKALEVTQSELGKVIDPVDNSSSFGYIVGKYIFTGSHKISTKDIMVGALSIDIEDSDGKTEKDDIYDKMRIYYIEYDTTENDVSKWKIKNYIGSGEIPETFDIEYVNYALSDTETFKVYFETDNSLDAVTVNSGDKVEVPEEPVKEGYKFDGWYKEDGNKFDFNTSITSDITLTAKWIKTTCTVTFTGMDNTDDFEDASINCGSTLTNINTPTSTDRGDFVNWYYSGEVFDINSTIEDDMILLARFEDDFIHTITFHDGEKILEALMQQVEEGKTANEPEGPEKEGYTFIDWYTSKGNPFDFATKIMNDLNLYAEYSLNTYTVQFYSEGVELTDLKETVNYNTVVSKPLMEDTSTKKFTGWYIDESLNSLYNFDTKVTADLKLYAGYVDRVMTVSDETELTSALSNSNIDIINLENDIALTSSITLNRSVTINGSDNTLSSSYENASEFIIIDTNDKVTINKLVIDAKEKTRGIKVNSGNLLLNESTIKNAKVNDIGAGIYLTGNSNLEVISSTFTNNVVTSYVDDNHFEYSSDLFVDSAVANITSGTINNIFVNATETGKGTLNVKDGNIINVYLEYSANNKSTLNYTGGTISNLHTSNGSDVTSVSNPSINTYTSGE